MTVSIDPSEVRRSSGALQSRLPRLRLPLRAVLIAGLGAGGLAAFSVCAFSFFSDLADPRTRLPRLAPMAATMPDLKDGIPALVPETGRVETQRQAALGRDGPDRDALDRTSPRPILNLPPPSAAASVPAATESPEEGPPPAKDAASEPLVPELRTGSVAPARNAARAPEMQAAALIAPARTAATLAPTKAETVRAKAEQPAKFVSLDPKAEPDAPAPAAAPKRKPPAKAAQRSAAARPVAEAAPAEEAAPAPRKAASDDPEVLGVKIPGSGRLRDGIKAMFGGQSEGE